MLKRGVFRCRRFAHEETSAKQKKEEEDGAKVSGGDRQRERTKKLKVTAAIAADMTAIAARAGINPRFLIIFSLFLLSFHIF